MDVANAAAQGPLRAPFYVPPEAFIYSYFPLEAQWQLLPDPMGMEDWWALPQLSVPFFAKGMRLVSDTLQSVNFIQATK